MREESSVGAQVHMHLNGGSHQIYRPLATLSVMVRQHWITAAGMKDHIRCVVILVNVPAEIVH